MREKILAMEAGKLLNELIAEDVFGWVKNDLGFDVWFDGNTYTSNIKPYSTDISAAWEVFTQFDFPMLEKGHDEEGNDYYVCKISPQYVIADTAPLAICRAALLAVTQP